MGPVAGVHVSYEPLSNLEAYRHAFLQYNQKNDCHGPHGLILDPMPKLRS